MTKKKKKSKKWIWLVILGLVAVMVAFSVIKSQIKEDTEVTAEESKVTSINEVVTGSGKIFPEKEVKISSDVSGEIIELYVVEGDSVQVGQVLAKIDPETYISAVERGKASLNNTKAQRSIAKAQLASTTAQREQIYAQLENARVIHERNKALLTSGVISQADFDNSLSNLNALEANVRVANSNIESSKESAKSAEFTIKSSEASLRELQTSLSRTTIKAPVSGVISLLNVEQGERVVGTIQMAGTEMMRIANLNAMEVQVEISENNILKVQEGDTVDIEVDAYLDKVFKGTVTEIANTASNATTGASQASLLSSTQVTNFIVKIRIDPSSYNAIVQNKTDYPFRPGMSASVDIYTNRVDDVLTVPIQAVTAREEEVEGEDIVKEIVFVIQADTVERREVRTGIQDDTNIHILSGVKNGELVVTGPYSTLSKELKKGEKVKIKEEEDEEDE